MRMEGYKICIILAIYFSITTKNTNNRYSNSNISNNNNYNIKMEKIFETGQIQRCSKGDTSKKTNLQRIRSMHSSSPTN